MKIVVTWKRYTVIMAMVTDHVIILTKSIAHAVILIVVSVKDIQRYPAQAVAF